MAGELTKRVAVAAIGIPLAVVVLYVGGWALAALLSVVAAVGAAEFASIGRATGGQPPRSLTIAAAVGFVLLAGALATPARTAFWSWLLITVLVLVSLTTVIWTRGVDGRPLASAAGVVLGALLTGATLGYAIFLREALAHSPYRFRGGQADALMTSNWAGFSLVAFPLAITWINDTCAYFGGRSFGKHKLLARVSPGKTVEGTIAGLAGSVIIAVLYARLVFTNWLGIPVGVMAALAAGIVISIAAVVGDLAESLLKREAGVKDSGALLPGHGGVLDRFDALYFTLPVSYWLLFVILRLGGGAQ